VTAPAPFDYAAVTVEDVRDRGAAAIRDVERALDALAAVPEADRTVANTLEALDGLHDQISQASGRYAFLAQVAPEKSLRDAALAFQQEIDAFATRLGFRQDLYEAIRQFADSPAAADLDPDAARLLEFTLRDFRRNGFELDAGARARVEQLKQQLVDLGVHFRRNIDENDDALWLTRDQLAGLPAGYIDGLTTEERDGTTHYRVSLDYPEMYPFLEAADDESLRRELFLLNYNKAAAENLPLLDQALAARAEAAALLGYPSWADYILEIRMAKTTAAALEFLEDLERRVRVKANVDIDELTASKRAHTGDPDARLEIWDWRYYQQRVLRESYDVDQFAVAEYFPLEATLNGMLDVYARLVGVRFAPIADTHAWHPDVRLYAIEDAATGAHLAHAYMDLHPRPDKYGHAAAFTLRPGRRLPDGAYQPPVSAIVANFTKPTASTPSLLRHSEVRTLFHEFGHILHQTLTRARYTRFSGTSVERDFVEAPSQMLEHWIWDPDVLAPFARHVETGEELPTGLLERMTASRNVASGLHWLRQIYFARLDLAYHGPLEEGETRDSDRIAQQLHPITAFPFPENTHFQAGFGHLFGYDAGYYGYLWSKVFGDDMFERFEQDGLAAGADYRRIILEQGGAIDAADLVRTFLGRDPRNDAFLRDIGLEA
jgi:thimet oligopeptidase